MTKYDEPKYKVGDLIQASKSEEKEVFLITKVEPESALIDGVYDVLTEDGKTIMQFCYILDDEHHFRKIN